jgi:ABC transporter substrate binding protein
VSRREFLASAAAVTAWPIAARAQEVGRTYRLGFLTPVVREAPAITAFLDELRLAGFIEGENLLLITDGFNVRNDEINERAGSVVMGEPDAIISGPLLHTRALQQLTHSIPLVAMTEDMVAEKLVASLARPGGNITGISLLSPELDGKRQDILIEAVPQARRIAALADANVTPIRHLHALQEAARTRGVTLFPISVGTRDELPALFTAPRRPVLKRSMCWRAHCSSSIDISSSTAPLHCAYPPSISGRIWPKTVGYWHMGHASSRFIGSARESSSSCYAEPRPPKLRSSSPVFSNWWSIFRRPKAWGIKCRRH